ncbi:ubiquitin-associated and SH3 domain-containing protein B-like [Notothenia coriiceps]|uniref:Ubiquitin-associated and SH3 domain-containing protein B-like n=1 Tax=Notothenia coriiceps TaxID=8208 RepID=A0A6I9PSX5_9TELE|nr:PREDICTED: ubiquitin-associated and SH3 domain-containing protein B-like [Notothenia coriiceps]
MSPSLLLGRGLFLQLLISGSMGAYKRFAMLVNSSMSSGVLAAAAPCWSGWRQRGEHKTEWCFKILISAPPRFTLTAQSLFQMKRQLDKLADLIVKVTYESDPIPLQKPQMEERVKYLIYHLIKSSFVVEKQPCMPTHPQKPLIIKTGVQFTTKVRLLVKLPEVDYQLKVKTTFDKDLPPGRVSRQFFILTNNTKVMDIEDYSNGCLSVEFRHLVIQFVLVCNLLPEHEDTEYFWLIKDSKHKESIGELELRLKALVSTGGRSVQAACDWLFSHVDDPFLDDPLPREFVLYLRPSGPLQNQLSHFWQQSRVTCGKNKAHNIFPHITLCQFFMCADHKVEDLCEALQASVQQWRGRFPSPLPLELYTSSNFIGLFVEETVADILKQFAADFSTEAAKKAEVHVEPHKKQLHVTLAYNFPTNHLPSLEKLAKGIEVKLGCDWLAVLFSRDIRFANHETLRVMYPYSPQNEDELELVPGDFVFMSPVDQSITSEGWVYGTSLGSGLSGLLPENYVSLADESETWVFHGSHSFFSCGPSDRSSKDRGMFDGLLDSRRMENSSPGDTPTLSLICHPMQVQKLSSLVLPSEVIIAQSSVPGGIPCLHTPAPGLSTTLAQLFPIPTSTPRFPFLINTVLSQLIPS